MAPPLTRPSICGLQAALSSCRVSTTTTAKTATCAPAPWRTFSTTPVASQAFAVPPESPKFITVPEPPQSAEPKLPPIKGHLPVPRDMFPRREGNRKVKPAYISAATQVSQAELAGKPPRSEEEARQRLMAAARRDAFTSGIQGLYVRKSQRVQRTQARSEARRQANQAAAAAPERLDDVLTRSTIREATLRTSVAPSPERFAAAEAARARHQQQIEAKAEARRDALAQLYVAAQSFILDEAALEARVNSIFTEDYHKYGATDRAQSIWEQHRAPVSVSDLQADLVGQSSKLTEANAGPQIKTTKRQKAVAEELTGGKL
ncbi:hypothetical protein NEMBOFW57_002935 [Staphylotrichum longicolle]|uniref:Uncharacterized protein n=1 Tax=Staphylotrichum longicolle TaxID=669026 RepID=A0AAD4I442_9PEZI|nr:hypothetical protein NEMBOFW57_002935 [Staphylotrichum longicolle]